MYKMKIQLLISLFLFGLFFVFSGCNQNLPPGMPKLYPATITVFSDGQPLVGASVTIWAQDPALTSWWAGATTDTEGNAKLVTWGRYPGAAAGSYNITIEKTEIEASKLTGEYSEERRAEFEADAAGRKHYDLFPDFSSLEKSTLKIEIKPGTNEEKVDVGKTRPTLLKVYL
jgi:hypothetical protein